MRTLVSIGIASSLAMGMIGIGCAFEDVAISDDASPPDAAAPAEIAAEEARDVVPSSGDAADTGVADDAGAAVPPDARWICVGDNPGRIAGCRNGSESCDDDAFQVTAELLGPLVVACFAGDQGSGSAYIALNTGPQCEAPTCSGNVNDRPRCQGWEKCECENAWDAGNLQYATDEFGVIQILECPAEGATREVDLSAYVGFTMWVGSHSRPDGTGRMTEACLSVKTW